MLYSINWAIFYVFKPLLLEILHKICIENICSPVCDFMNFEINFSFLINPFYYIIKKSEQKCKYVKNEMSF